MTKIPSTELIYDIFSQLNDIPRSSWHEEKVAEYLCMFAEQLGLDYTRDEHNCVVIRKSATLGYENVTPVVLLNHMDMVCVAEKGISFNPLCDPINTYVEDGWIKARGTSLGADNGIGLSMALAVLQDDSIVHGPLEVITTTNEEDGMTGAANLSADAIRGRNVINLDSEDYETITVGAAGAYLQFTSLPLVRKKCPSGYSFFEISIRGGLGGHSGVDINKGRANANKLMCEMLHKIIGIINIVVASVRGGEANNSIAMTAEAVVGVSVDQEKAFYKIVRDFTSDVKDEYCATDPGITIEYTPMVVPDYVISDNCVTALINSIHALPVGVLRMSKSLKETVETSNNIGMVRTDENSFFVSNHTRSFIDEDMVSVGGLIRNIFNTVGASTEVIMEAPAWSQDTDTDFMKLTENTFVDVLKFRPRKVAMHFVLEAGYFVHKFPGIEIVSIGPKIIEPHSTSERVSIETVNNIWKVLVELLYRICIH